jgi:hypothetical protein
VQFGGAFLTGFQASFLKVSLACVPSVAANAPITADCEQIVTNGSQSSAEMLLIASSGDVRLSQATAIRDSPEHSIPNSGLSSICCYRNVNLGRNANFA